MPRPEKVQAVADIKNWLEGAQAVYLTEYRHSPTEFAETRAPITEFGAD